ncbi:MAG: pyroglutamyl-peptidase I [Microbacteriaceae bacterium]|nr:pyroglutamyl-peptidase I [Microbacteriaceae bacterium]
MAAASERTVLVTGFDPFGGESVNPSWEAVKQLPREITGAKIATLQVPTVFYDSLALVREAIIEHRPEIILCVGQAGGRAEITPERIAININDASIADNAEQQPLDEPIAASAPAAYFSTLPVKAMVAAVREAGVPARLSNSAGTFVCNHLMFGVLDFIAREGASFGVADARAGFVHVPFVPEQVAPGAEDPALPLDQIVRGLEAAITAALQHEGAADAQLALGATH